MLRDTLAAIKAGNLRTQYTSISTRDSMASGRLETNIHQHKKCTRAAHWIAPNVLVAIIDLHTRSTVVVGSNSRDE